MSKLKKLRTVTEYVQHVHGDREYDNPDLALVNGKEFEDWFYSNIKLPDMKYVSREVKVEIPSETVWTKHNLAGRVDVLAIDSRGPHPRLCFIELKVGTVDDLKRYTLQADLYTEASEIMVHGMVNMAYARKHYGIYPDIPCSAVVVVNDGSRLHEWYMDPRVRVWEATDFTHKAPLAIPLPKAEGRWVMTDGGFRISVTTGRLLFVEGLECDVTATTKDGERSRHVAVIETIPRRIGNMWVGECILNPTRRIGNG